VKGEVPGRKQLWPDLGNCLVGLIKTMKMVG